MDKKYKAEIQGYLRELDASTDVETITLIKSKADGGWLPQDPYSPVQAWAADALCAAERKLSNPLRRQYSNDGVGEHREIVEAVTGHRLSD